MGGEDFILYSFCMATRKKIGSGNEMVNLILRCFNNNNNKKKNLSFYRWVHSECASVSEPPDEKCICIICREAQTVVSETEQSSTQVDIKAEPEEEPMELGMYLFVEVYTSYNISSRMI